MSNTPPPMNYQWIGNTLSYDLDPNAVGLKLTYKKDGETIEHIIFDNMNSAPSSVSLDSSFGPSGTVVGMTTNGSSSEWGPPGRSEITNTQ